MKKIFNQIWMLALPYQDKRDDAGHAEITTKFAWKLVESEKGDEDVIIPAIIMHDIGYSQLTKERRLQVFDKGLSKEERLKVQMEHQNESVKLARVILGKVDYPPKLTEEILEIISQHDSREGFISKNEGLVRDADKLSRTSREGVAAGEARRKGKGEPPEESRWKKMEENINKPGYFYSDKARQMALADLKLRIQEAVPSL
jgi:HD superfamily phosphodiesterase